VGRGEAETRRPSGGREEARGGTGRRPSEPAGVWGLMTSGVSNGDSTPVSSRGALRDHSSTPSVLTALTAYRPSA
jgi:hypothetical protein